MSHFFFLLFSLCLNFFIFFIIIIYIVIQGLVHIYLPFFSISYMVIWLTICICAMIVVIFWHHEGTFWFAALEDPKFRKCIFNFHVSNMLSVSRAQS